MAQHHRIHVAPEGIQGPQASLGPDASAYLRRVLRLAPGDPVEVFDGAGRAWSATVADLGEEGGALTLEAPREALAVPRPFVLLQGLPKGDKLELVIQKATELGVTEVRPLACARSVVKLDATKAAKRVARWQKIAEEAARQCGRADVPAVHPPATVAEAVAQVGSRSELAPLIAWVGESDVGLTEALAAQAHRPGHALMVGPEGGFTGEEVRLARAAGFQPVRLGPRILRTETVALAVLAAVRFSQGDLG